MFDATPAAVNAVRDCPSQARRGAFIVTTGRLATLPLLTSEAERTSRELDTMVRALPRLRTDEGIDAVLRVADESLPWPSRLDAMRTLKADRSSERHRHLPVLILSGSASPSDVLWC